MNIVEAERNVRNAKIERDVCKDHDFIAKYGRCGRYYGHFDLASFIAGLFATGIPLIVVIVLTLSNKH